MTCGTAVFYDFLQMSIKVFMSSYIFTFNSIHSMAKHTVCHASFMSWMLKRLLQRRHLCILSWSSSTGRRTVAKGRHKIQKWEECHASRSLFKQFRRMLQCCITVKFQKKRSPDILLARGWADSDWIFYLWITCSFKKNLHHPIWRLLVPWCAMSLWRIKQFQSQC